MAALLQILLNNSNDHVVSDRAIPGDSSLHGLPGAPQDVWTGWQDGRDLMAISVSAGASSPRLVRTFAEMASARPDVLVVKGFGLQALRALMYARWQRRVRVVLWLTSHSFPRHAVPAAPGQLLLKLVDAVVAGTSATAHAVELRGVPAARIFTLADPHDTSAFLDSLPTRDPEVAHRMICVGPLTPAAGVADFQSAVASWAEANPGRPVEIWWAGHGSLRGVLEAQPLPDGVTQRFLGVLEAPARVTAFAQCGLLVLPSLQSDWSHMVHEAQAAGLPVLGSRRSHDVMHLVQDGVTGWRFDPFSPESVYAGLDQALQTSCADLDRMRAAGRDACLQSEVALEGGTAEAPGIGGRMARIVAAVAQRMPQQPMVTTELQA